MSFYSRKNNRKQEKWLIQLTWKYCLYLSSCLKFFIKSSSYPIFVSVVLAGPRCIFLILIPDFSLLISGKSISFNVLFLCFLISLPKAIKIIYKLMLDLKLRFYFLDLLFRVSESFRGRRKIMVLIRLLFQIFWDRLVILATKISIFRLAH